MNEKEKNPSGEKGYGGSFASRHLFKPFSTRLSAAVYHTSITPTQLTNIGFLIGMIGVFMLLSENYLVLILGCVLIFTQHVFDCADGDLARMKGMTSKTGALNDEFTDRMFENALFFIVTLVAYKNTGDIWVWPIGMLAVIGNLRMVALYLKLEGLGYKGQSIKQLPAWRQLLNYGGENNLLIIIVGVLTGYILYALLAIAILTNGFSFVRFFYTIKKLEASQ